MGRNPRWRLRRVLGKFRCSCGHSTYSRPSMVIHLTTTPGTHHLINP